MTSNVPFEKNKMASILAASVITRWSVHKMQGGWAPGEILKEIESAVEKKLKKCNVFSWETTSGKAVLQILSNNKASCN